MAKNFQSSNQLIIQLSNTLKKWKWTILTGLGIVVLYFVLRLVNLTILPIFCDEAIYIRWSQVMRAEPTLRFLPLSDGKQPLFMWLAIPFLKLFTDPLIAGRMVSVFSGLASMVGLFLITYYLFKSKRAALFSILIYSILPFTLFLDRVALVDSLLLVFAIWSFFLSVLLIKYQRIDLAILTGIVLGGGLITKSPAMFFIGLIPTTILLLEIKGKKILVQIFKLIGLWLIVYLFAFAIYNILRLGPNFHLIALRNKDYVFSLREIIVHPHNPFLVHLRDISGWLPNLFTWPIFLMSLGGIFIGFFRRKGRILLSLLVWFLIPLLVQLAMAKVFTPRYILFTIFPLIIFAALSADFIFEKLNRKIPWGIIVLLILVLWPLKYDYFLLASPEKAPLPESKRRGYLSEWTSGYGIAEVRDYLKALPKEKQIIVGTEGSFGTLPDGLLIYFDKDPKVTIIGVGLGLDKVPEQLVDSAAHGNPTYLVVNKSRMRAQNDPKLKLIMEIPKAKGEKGQDSLLLYQVK